MVAMLVSRWRSSVLLLSWTLLALSGLPVAQAFAQDAAKVAGTDVPSPKRIKTVLPVYPPDAQAQGIRGIVILELLIDQQGHVASAEVVRSVPGLDDAALAAVKEWEYEVTKVDGKPVSVRLTAPITFTLKPPEISRDKGIPALQQGVPPAYPADLKEKSATVTVQIALDGEGNVADALVTNGESPWADLVLKALRTWKFPSSDPDQRLAVKLEVHFVAGSKGVSPRVDLRLTDARHTAPQAAPAASTETAHKQPASPPAPGEGAAPPVATSSPAPPAAPPSTAGPGAGPPPAEAHASPSPSPAPSDGAIPKAPTAPPSPAPVAAAQQPSIEMVPAPPPPRPVDAGPPENGVSSIRDITLSQGIPDLVKGRRPVPPPLARINGVTGSVEVHFAVNPGGTTAVASVSGPEMLKAAAQAAVSSWAFRRTSAERLHLVALFDYQTDSATATLSVEKAPQTE